MKIAFYYVFIKKLFESVVATSLITNLYMQFLFPNVNYNPDNISNNNNKITTVPINLEESVLLYEAKRGNLATRVLNVIGELQLVHSIVENGTITGIGNVTNTQTWINTLRTPKVTYGKGKGVMITDDGQRATWTGYDIGQLQNNSSIIYKGITIFNSNATEDMAFLNNLVGLHITIVQDNNQATKIWKWQ